MSKRILEAEVHREPDGLWAQVPELGGCFATADTYDELAQALAEAIAMCMTEHEAADDMADASDDAAELPRLLVRFVGLRLEVEHDSRPDNADDLTKPAARRHRRSHRGDSPPGTWFPGR